MDYFELVASTFVLAPYTHGVHGPVHVGGADG